MKNPILLLSCLLACSTTFSQKDSAQIYLKKGIVEKSAKRYLVASGYFDRAVRFDPGLKEAYLENGFVNIEMRKTDAAIANFAKVLEIEPANVDAASQLMDLYYNYKLYQKAIQLAAK